MRLIGLAVILTVSLILAPLAGEAQPAARLQTIGILSPFSAPSGPAPSMEAFLQRLRELGYEEGRNVAFEYRYAEGSLERLSHLAGELVRQKVDLIFTTWGTAAPLAAQRITSTIPIVISAAGDPVATGLVTSLTRPGGNVTGLSSLALELEEKRLELLRDLVPRAFRVAVLWDPANPYSGLAFKREQAAAKTLGLKLQPVPVHQAQELKPAFTALTRDRPDALVVHAFVVLIQHRARIVEFAAQTRLPAVYPLRDYVDAGGLMSYGASLTDMSRRAALYVDKILKGTKPGDLPVEQPTKFELVINLKTAKAIGLTIPQSVLARADQVIE
jgi:putative tryptophan/tyrosine transport system substrate-binding protein